MSKKKQLAAPRTAEQSRVLSEELKALREELERISSSAKKTSPAEDSEGQRFVDLYAYAITSDRERMLDVAVTHLVRLSRKAHEDQARTSYDAILDDLKHALRRLVLDGTVQQQIVCSIAVRIARLSATERAALPEPVVRALIDALITVLRVAAPTTRDTAVEGLGGLLKTYPDAEKDRQFPPEPKLPTSDATPSAIEFFDRLARRRLMTLAVARHASSRREFFRRLKDPIDTAMGRIRKTPDPTPELLKTLYERADLLRTLPAVLQHDPDAGLWKAALDLLRDAASPTTMREEDDGPLVIAYARFQESVFRTIGVMVRKGVIGVDRKQEAGDALADFDSVIADAVNAIRPTLAGPPEACNAQVRATIAILRTAMRLIEPGDAQKTRAALLPLFRSVGDKPSPWLNLGIAEGLYRGLPYLLSDGAHNELTEPALKALFVHLHRDYDFGDFARAHRHLIAIACFRRILIRCMDLTSPRRGGDAETERDVQKLLVWPNAKHVLEVFQDRAAPGDAAAPRSMSRGVAETLIGGMAFESELLKRSAAIFRGWNAYSPVQRVVLTRILAAELRASSQDSRALARHALLMRIYAQLPTVSLSEEDQLNYVWDLLAALPAEAAGAADADLQDFVDHCGRRSRQLPRPRHFAEDLPGHVLAMISDSPSSKIADAIAREIDLNLQHERHLDERFDFAASLYQVTLRGPDKSVFDQLLPRVGDPRDRELVLLFRKHVETVQTYARANVGDVFEMDPLLVHVTELLDDLEDTESPTLIKLSKALDIYQRLASNHPLVWPTLAEGPVGGGLRELFDLFDGLATHGHESDSAPAVSQRRPLRVTYSDSVAQLQSHVSHYRELTISDFDGRIDALHDARDTARQLETALKTHEGLQPPERVLLVALMQHLRALFERTELWFCVEPHRRKEAGDEEMFWFLFTREWQAVVVDQTEWLKAAKLLSEGEARQAQEQQLQKSRETHVLAQLRESYGLEPPPYPNQRARFELFYVEWMESELRVNALERQLRSRWSRPFRFAYGVMTHQWRILLVLLVPCVAAAVLHGFGAHKWEGVGFFVLATVVAVMMPLAFLPTLRFWLTRRFKRAAQPAEARRPYRLHALLPRLARLIAVPMALTVELSHSYEFSLHASTWVLVLLMVMAYVTTRFFISREIVDLEDRRQPEEPVVSVRERMRQVMAVALAHSFGIAMMFAIIFASTGVESLKRPDEHPPGKDRPTHSSRFFTFIDSVYSHVDAVHPPHEYPTFAGVLPRDAVFDLGRVMTPRDREIPPGLTPHLRFVFYPTIVLTWTALGLFVGVFLEGFVKGERLRGPSKEEEE